MTRAHVRPPASAVAAVALGGAMGASLRLALESLAPWQPPGFPWATFGINVLGCLLIGALLAWLLGSAGQPAWLRPFLATGLLGGFTTFSAFAVESVRLLDAGAWGTAGSYVAGSLVLGAARCPGRRQAGRPWQGTMTPVRGHASRATTRRTREGEP